MIKIYAYSKCSTCNKALHFLEEKDIPFKAVDITTHPPTLAELKVALKQIKASGGQIKNLLNTSGIQYRELKISDKIKGGISETELLNLMAANGRLIKRPLIIGQTTSWVGFQPKDWDKVALLKLAAE